MTRATVARLLGLAGLGVLGRAFLPVRAAAGSGSMAGMMSGGMTSSTHDGDMRTVMRLFTEHDRIRRQVTLLPDGVRTLTESDEPATAAQLQGHVVSMYARLDADRPFTMMSRTLPFLFRHATGYRRTLTATPKGVSVTETSRNPQMVAVLHEHAKEVTAFVEEGMPAMMNGMGSM